MPAALAFRYARVLADLNGSGDAGRVQAELATFVTAMRESADLRTAMESPAVPTARKRAVIAKLAETLPLSDIVRRFLFVVVDHRRAGQLHDISEAFEQVMDERLGVVRADVSSARDLNEPQRAELVSSLTRLTGKQVRARFEVRPELIGGVMARIGSTIYDGSVKGQLEALKVKLAGAER